MPLRMDEKVRTNFIFHVHNLSVSSSKVYLFRFSVVFLFTAIEAQKKYMATNGRGYPIIFSDNMMPEVSGLDAAKIIRSLEHEKGLHAPDQQSFIAILTADVWDDDDFVDGSIDVVLPKPITQQKLEGILKALSERRLK